MTDPEDLMAHLEQKRREVSAMQEAANTAKEQALALLRLQRRMAEIDAMANGTGDVGPEGAAIMNAASADSGMQRSILLNSQLPEAFAEPTRTPPMTTLSAEDRLRFGLEVDERVATNAGASSASAQALPPSSAFVPSAGASNSRDNAVSHASPAPAPRYSSLSPEDRRRFGLDSTNHSHNDSKAAATSPSRTERYHQISSVQHHPDVLWGNAGSSPSGSLSMARTIAQLEAVGATKVVADLKESERRLQSLKRKG